jgi:hypothetical protein
MNTIGVQSNLKPLQQPCPEGKHCLVPAGHALGMRSKGMTSISSVPGQLWDTDVIM